MIFKNDVMFVLCIFCPSNKNCENLAIGISIQLKLPGIKTIQRLILIESKFTWLCFNCSDHKSYINF